MSREAVTGTNRDFASLLDDLFTANERPEEPAPRPTIPFDYLTVADELHSGRIKVSGDAAAAEYRAAGEGVEAELSALLATDRVIPVAHGTTFDALRDVSPLLASRSGLNTAESSLEDVAAKVAAAAAALAEDEA